MFRDGYILVTPAKNEEKYLPKVAKAIIEQTLKPNLWVIVDDGSTDSTPKIIKRLVNSYNWIKTIRLPGHPRDITFHYAYVCREGFRYALKYTKENHIPFEYIALVDADTVVERRYFEKLIEKFERDVYLGIASGTVYSWNQKKKRWIREINLTGHPRGTGRIWRKRCFFDTGGYFIVPSPDSVSNRLALKKGWKIQQFDDVKSYQLRETSSAEGKIKGYIKNGEMARYLEKPLIRVIGTSAILLITHGNPIYSFGYLYGFLFFPKHNLKNGILPVIRRLYDVDNIALKQKVFGGRYENETQ